MVCVPVASAGEARSLTEGPSRPAATQVLVAVRGSLGETHLAELADWAEWLLASEQDTEVGLARTALAVSSHADVLLVSPGISMPPDLPARLKAAARSDSTIASATPLSIGRGGIELRGGLAGGTTLLDAARRVARGDPVWPRIATAGPACAYLRREALELIGPPPPAGTLGEAVASWAQQATRSSMLHVLADDALVDARGWRGDASEPAAKLPQPRPSTPAGDLRRPRPAGGVAGNDEDPEWGREALAQETIAAEERVPLTRALARASAALRGLSVTIDGRALSSTGGGTAAYIKGVVLALASLGGLRLRVLVAPGLADGTRAAFAALRGVELLDYERAVADTLEPTDIVHRPQQAFTPEDLVLLQLVGRHVVLGQQDLIAYHNPSYHPDVETWQRYRRTTRLAMAGADQVVFFSEHARRDALAEELLPAARSHVVGIGADSLEPVAPGEAAPAALARAASPFLLCLGADYAHKNRPFAIELLRSLQRLGWDGHMVLAGPHVEFGSSREREQELLHEDARLAASVLDLGLVGEQEKRWLYAHARALVFPTLYEGYGLLPAEAARAGLPCLFAAQASLGELAAAAATLVPWDVEESARKALPLLADGAERERHVAALRGSAGPSWAEVATQLLAVYEHALGAPFSESAGRSWQELTRERHLAYLDREERHARAVAQEYQDAYHSLSARVAVGLPLIDRDGLLSVRQQRGLKRLAGHPRLARVALAGFALLGRSGDRETPP